MPRGMALDLDVGVGLGQGMGLGQVMDMDLEMDLDMDLEMELTGKNFMKDQAIVRDDRMHVVMEEPAIYVDVIVEDLGMKDEGQTAGCP